MDVIFQKGTHEKFNSSTFEEGNICFVNQPDGNDYIYRIGTEDKKIPILGNGYSLSDNGDQFKILKTITNCNDTIKLGEMISYTLGSNQSWTIPSIIGCGSIKNGAVQDKYLILDVKTTGEGAIIPNPHKPSLTSLGATNARWSTLYLQQNEDKNNAYQSIDCYGDFKVFTRQIYTSSTGIGKGDIILNPASGYICSGSDNTQIKKYYYLGNNTNPWDGIYSEAYYAPEDETEQSQSMGIKIKTISYTITTDEGEEKTYKYPSIEGFGGPNSQYLILDGSADVKKHIYIIPNPNRKTNKASTNLGFGSIEDFWWTNIYVKNVQGTSVQTETTALVSDKRLKEVQSSNILQNSLKIYDNLEPVCYKYKNIIPENDFSRTHIGFLAQDAAELIERFNLTSEDCSFVQAEPLLEGTSDEIKNILTDGYRYYFNYNELHGLHTLKNHEQDARLTELETKNRELENIISNLKTQIELLKLAVGG